MSDLEGAINALKNGQQQLDMDGIFVGVSRQALEEVLDGIERLQKVISEIDDMLSGPLTGEDARAVAEYLADTNPPGGDEG